MKHLERTDKFNKKADERRRSDISQLFVLRWIFFSLLISEVMQLERKQCRCR